MRLRGLGAQDETILVPLNTVDVESTDQKKEPTQRDSSFHCGRYGQYKAQYTKLKKDGYYETKIKNGVPNHADPSKPICDTCGKTQKTGNCFNGADAATETWKKKRELAILTNKTSERSLPSVATKPGN